MEYVSSWLLLIAVWFVGLLLTLPTLPKFLFLVTTPAWFCVYLVVLGKNYRKKVPVPALGRLVEYEKQPVFYKLLYVELLFVGLFTALCMLVMQGSRLMK
jgi:hypothetical protein